MKFNKTMTAGVLAAALGAATTGVAANDDTKLEMTEDFLKGLAIAAGEEQFRQTHLISKFCRAAEDEIVAPLNELLTGDNRVEIEYGRTGTMGKLSPQYSNQECRIMLDGELAYNYNAASVAKLDYNDHYTTDPEMQIAIATKEILAGMDRLEKRQILNRKAVRDVLSDYYDRRFSPSSATPALSQ